MKLFCCNKGKDRKNLRLLIGLLLLIPVVSSHVAAQEIDLEIPVALLPVSFSEVLKGLADKEVSSLFDRNSTLSKAISERGLGFALSPNARRVISEAGGSELLFIAIEREAEKRSKNIVELIAELRKPRSVRTIESRRERIALIRRLMHTLGDPDLLVGKDFELREMVKWTQKALPSAEAGLHFELNRRQKPL